MMDMGKLLDAEEICFILDDTLKKFMKDKEILIKDGGIVDDDVVTWLKTYVSRVKEVIDTEKLYEGLKE